MASVFDGIGRICTTAFGAGVTYLAAGKPARVVPSKFREAPVEIEDDDGRMVLIIAPTWWVRRDLVPEIARGDRIEPGNGKTYTVITDRPNGSPASDATLMCELERIFP